MLFYGGMVPAFMVVKTLGLLDTYAALILPFVIVQFNMLVVKNYMEGFPKAWRSRSSWTARDIYHSGAHHLPDVLSRHRHGVAAVRRQLLEQLFHALLYTSSPSMKTLQLFLYDTIYSADNLIEKFVGSDMKNVSTRESVPPR